MQRTRQALGALVSSALGGGGIESDSYGKEFGRLAQADYHRAGARKAGVEGQLLQDQLAARGGLGQAFAAMFGDRVGDPRGLATAFRAGHNSNLGHLATYAGEMLNQGRRDAGVGMASTDPLGAAFRLAAGGATPPAAFEQSGAGQTLNRFTGATGVGPVGQASVGRLNADAAAGNALAGQRGFLGAAGRLYNLGDPSGAGDRYIAPPAGRGGAGGGSDGLKSADVNAIRSTVAGLFDGLYDPVTGSITLRDDQSRRLAVAITARAEEIMLERLAAGQPLAHVDAVALAAREAGIEVPQFGGAARGGGGGGTADDPLGLFSTP